MSRFRNKRFAFVAILLAFALIGAACGGGEEDGPTTTTTDEEPEQGGTLIFGAEQEMAVANTHTTAGNQFWNTIINGTPILESAYLVTPELEFVPQLIEGEAEITEDPFTVTYRIKEDAAWSDGTPITADDFIFHYETYVNEDNDMASRNGYDLITDFERISDKEVKFNFKEPFAGYKLLFSQLLPAHALEGEDFNKVWNKKIYNPKNDEPIGSGPFLFEEWNKGADLTIVRNDNYWGEHPAYLDEIVFRFVTDTNTEIQAIKAGEVHAIYPSPQLTLADLDSQPGIATDHDSQVAWQHLDFQYGNELLAQDFVRQAIAYGIDRQAIVDRLVTPLNPEGSVLNNVLYLSTDPNYEEHWDQYTFDPAQSKQILEDNGCTEGADGIYECDGQKLSFGYVSTAGNELRELMFQIIQQNLKEAGIEVKNKFGEADVVFGKTLSSKKWDMFQFGWVGSPDVTQSNAIFICKGDQNYGDYCNEEATRLMEEGKTTIDDAERARLYNEADALIAEDVPLLPLWQYPAPYYFSDQVHNLINNPSQFGPTWNAAEWWISGGGGASE